MPDAGSELRISCKATINGEERFVSGFTAEMEVDAFWPKVTMETHVSKEAYTQSVKLGSFDAAKEMGEVQSSIFQQREEEDFEINIGVQGGEGGSLNFKGYTIGSDFTLSVSSVRRSDSAIAGYARLSALNFDATKASYAAQADIPDPNLMVPLAQYIKACADVLHRKGYPEPLDEKTLDGKSRKLQKQINEQVMPEFEKLMAASIDTMGWNEVLENVKEGKFGDPYVLGHRIMAILAGNATGSFEATIGQLNEEFQCCYIPKWDRIGCLKNRQELLADPEELDVVIVAITMHTTNGNTLFPVKYAAVTPAQKLTYAAQMPCTAYVAVPEENVQPGASMIRTNGPQWLDSTACVRACDRAGRSRKTEGAKASEAGAVPKEAEEKAKEATDITYEVLKEWGKSLYVYNALAGSYADIVTILVLDAEVGKCYTVKSGEKELFTGVLWRVVHSVSTGGGSSPAALSTLTFKIVQMTGFRLPGLEEN